MIYHNVGDEFSWKAEDGEELGLITVKDENQGPTVEDTSNSGCTACIFGGPSAYGCIDHDCFAETRQDGLSVHFEKVGG